MLDLWLLKAWYMQHLLDISSTRPTFGPRVQCVRQVSWSMGCIAKTAAKKSCNFSVSPTGDDSTNRKPGLRRSKIYQHRELKPTKNGDFGFRASSSKGKLYPENMWSLANEDWECDRGWWNVSPWPISCGTSKHFALRRMAVARWASQLAKWPFPGNPNNYDLHCQVPIYIYIIHIYIYYPYIYILSIYIYIIHIYIYIIHIYIYILSIYIYNVYIYIYCTIFI